MDCGLGGLWWWVWAGAWSGFIIIIITTVVIINIFKIIIIVVSGGYGLEHGGAWKVKGGKGRNGCESGYGWDEVGWEEWHRKNDGDNDDHDHGHD